jgi:hypothetical protein
MHWTKKRYFDWRHDYYLLLVESGIAKSVPDASDYAWRRHATHDDEYAEYVRLGGKLSDPAEGL